MRPSTIYVISDLHLGGDPNEGPPGRGFRMCQQGELLAKFIRAIAAKDPEKERSELVINGDFIDFLAEHPIDLATGKPTKEWVAFHRDPRVACAVFRKVADEREKGVFDALGWLVKRGHRLTLLLGNHDIELALPLVREALRERLDPGGKFFDALVIRTDGLAYTPDGFDGLVVAHGNQADVFNEVDYQRLVAVDSSDGGSSGFSAPRGSEIVARAVNPLKREFPFVDLLKPEEHAMLPLLLALRYQNADYFRGVAREILGGKLQERVGRVFSRGGKISESPNESTRFDDPFMQLMKQTCTDDELSELATIIDGIEHDGRISKGEGIKVGLATWWIRKGFQDDVFCGARETHDGILRSVKARVANGAKTIILGHTHLALSVAVKAKGNTGQYLNTGTWADLMRLPPELTDMLEAVRSNACNDQALHKAVYAFVSQLRDNAAPSECIVKRPTFARIAYADGLANAALCCYAAGADPADDLFYSPNDATSGSGGGE